MIQEGQYTAPDELAAECEVSEFIASLVRLMKPLVVVETGCHRGDTSLAIVQALRANETGFLLTCDTDKGKVEETRLLCKNYVLKVAHCSGEELVDSLPRNSVNIAFLDSGGELARFREAQALIPKLAPISWVLLHDSLNGQDKCHANISAICNWPSIVFPYGRGLTLFCIGQSIAQDKIPR